MHWIYLSPHLDDVALSCGGLIWQQSQAGARVEVWTLCAGDPPPGAVSPFAESLHARWGAAQQAVAQRRAEDAASCRILGASWRHFSIPDCIYRREANGGWLYACNDALFGGLHPADADWIEQTAQLIAQAPSAAKIVAPLALGGHVDHQLVSAALKRCGRKAWRYADYPYVLTAAEQLDEMRRSGLRRRRFALSEAAMAAWVRAVAAHASQISSFWADLTAMEAALREYAAQNQGIVLWRAACKAALRSAG